MRTVWALTWHQIVLHRNTFLFLYFEYFSETVLYYFYLSTWGSWISISAFTSCSLHTFFTHKASMYFCHICMDASFTVVCGTLNSQWYILLLLYICIGVAGLLWIQSTPTYYAFMDYILWPDCYQKFSLCPEELHTEWIRCSIKLMGLYAWQLHSRMF